VSVQFQRLFFLLDRDINVVELDYVGCEQKADGEGKGGQEQVV